MLMLLRRHGLRARRFCSAAPTPTTLTIGDVLAEREKVFANLDSASAGEIHPYFDRWQSIQHDAPVHSAVDLMVQRNIGSLIVTQEGHGIVGIVTERDVMKKMAPHDDDDESHIVQDIMSNHILCIDPSTTVMEAFATMTKENIRHLAVIHTDMKQKVTKGHVPIDAMRSVLSIKDILKEYANDAAKKKASLVPEGAEMAVPLPTADAKPAADAAPVAITAGSLLRKKHEKIKLILNSRIDDSVSVAEAVREMARRNFGAVLIMDDELHVKGIFTERDYLTKVLHPKLNAHDVLVKDLCTKGVFTLKSDATLETCVHEAAIQNFRHLPVVDAKDDIVGVLSVKDVVREISREFKSTQGYWLMEYFKSKMEPKTEAPKVDVVPPLAQPLVEPPVEATKKETPKSSAS
ncbi:hypothetical protein SPRG_21098 [Saprolegnia parasitica CBS 223.65]|uniref:CBS domain-containing protein n=1 Tax=Saprolegnia parasitica (strain CBS 223.65) TaxID=695850 RepID=A0A067BW73_SAPPC|nr:hypothetical protein SPRG_21098 [Saprolegnia parasitica CBS 223.65]KDO22749.1 hypothetical protein SPRG_21098 [Saprolegnia parasitica CBS 223.65]|eukprot:XP_012206567.1 hypothetical protein SPRG_21098 [Saprolegnia parasitica CBS 223.65]